MAEVFMIVERLVFRAKYGQGDTVVSAFKEWRERFESRFGLKSRLLVDVVGPMFTVVVENEYRDMAHVAESEAREREFFADPEFQAWFASWSQATESGTRELYRVVE
jgi:hypothetical protein